MRMKRRALRRFLSTTFKMSNHAAIRYLQYRSRNWTEKLQQRKFDTDGNICWEKEEIESSKKTLLKLLKQCRHYSRGKGKAVIYKTHNFKYIVSPENTVITFIHKGRKKESKTLFDIERE